jgi:hypothetical protein
MYGNDSDLTMFVVCKIFRLEFGIILKVLC